MASRRASLASLSILRCVASLRGPFPDSAGSSTLHSGQRLAKPGLPGFSSNSSEQTTQVLTGKAIDNILPRVKSFGNRPSLNEFALHAI